MKYGNYDAASGLFLGFHDDAFEHVDNIPLPRIELSDEEWINRRTLAVDVSDEDETVRPIFPMPATQVQKSWITAERNRRIAVGFEFDGHVFQADPESIGNITGASTAAVAALVSGIAPDDVNWTGTGQPFTWLAADNTLVEMGPAKVIAFGNAAMAHKSAHIYAARAIKDVNPIPDDYAVDGRWPPKPTTLE